MIHGLLTALGTTAGKVSVGVALTAAAAGGAVATDAIDVPLVEDPAEVTIDEEQETDEGEAVDSVIDEQQEADEASAAEADNELGDDDDVDAESDEDDENIDDDNHGETVSEFAKTTELEGCEKGQAIAELASSKAADRRNNPEREHDPCDEDDEESDDEESDDEESDDEESDDEESDDDSKGKGQARGLGKGLDR